MREIDGWRFIGYYGVIYLVILVITVVSYPLAQEFAKPIASLIFPVAEDNSLLKNVLVTTAMYWGALLFYTIVIQKIKLKF
jgi:hypothetical protein